MSISYGVGKEGGKEICVTGYFEWNLQGCLKNMKEHCIAYCFVDFVNECYLTFSLYRLTVIPRYDVQDLLVSILPTFFESVWSSSSLLTDCSCNFFDEIILVTSCLLIVGEIDYCPTSMTIVFFCV